MRVENDIGKLHSSILHMVAIVDWDLLFQSVQKEHRDIKGAGN